MASRYHEPEQTSASQVNQGIQASGNVVADVMSVGYQATATKYSYDDTSARDVQQAIARLDAALASLKLQPSARDTLSDDVDALKTIAASPQPESSQAGDRLKSINDKLKMVGIMAKNVAEIAAPLTKIAELFRIPLHLLGF